jgi:hypothetical protein
MTIASSVDSEKELERFEARHICPEKALAELMETQKAINAQAHLN